MKHALKEYTNRSTTRFAHTAVIGISRIRSGLRAHPKDGSAYFGNKEVARNWIDEKRDARSREYKEVEDARKAGAAIVARALLNGHQDVSILADLLCSCCSDYAIRLFNVCLYASTSHTSFLTSIDIIRLRVLREPIRQYHRHSLLFWSFAVGCAQYFLCRLTLLGGCRDRCRLSRATMRNQPCLA